MSVHLAVILLVLVFCAYTAAIWITFGELTSISASSYRLKGNRKAWFMGWLIVMGWLCYYLDMGAWSHMMGLGFVMTGMSVDHRMNPSSREDEAHTLGTIMTIAAGFGGLFFEFGIWEPAAVFVVGTAILYWIRTNWIWRAEELAMMTIATGILMR